MRGSPPDARRRARHPRSPARRPLAGRVGAPRGLRRRRASWSAGWAARRSAATSPPRRSASGSSGRWPPCASTGCPNGSAEDWTVLCSSYSGRDRGDHRLLRGGRRARRPADRRQHRRRRWSTGRARRASRWSACRGSCSRGQPSPMWSSSRSRSRRWPGRPRGSPPRSRAPPTCSRSAPPTSRSAPIEIAERLAGTVPVIYGGELTTRRRPALEDPGEREREAAGVLLRAARGRPQRDQRLGRAARGRAALGGDARGRRPAPAPAAPLRADRGGDRRPRRRGGAGFRRWGRRARRGSSRR